jgi:Raf kinase inhibitor-like YbhB/YbcL family protein
MLEKLPEAIGRALVHQRAGMEQIVFNRLAAHRSVATIELSSWVFHNGGSLPITYTADGTGVSPPLAWRAAPQDAESLALIVEDADAPTPHPLVHAIVVNLHGSDGFLAEGALNSPEHRGYGLEQGRNSLFQQSWLPPDPPPGHGPHRYAFQLFALHEGAPFSAVPGRQEFMDAVFERASAAACLIGVYERNLRETLREPDAARSAAPTDEGAREVPGTIAPGGVLAPEAHAASARGGSLIS